MQELKFENILTVIYFNTESLKSFKISAQAYQFPCLPTVVNPLNASISVTSNTFFSPLSCTFCLCHSHLFDLLAAHLLPLHYSATATYIHPNVCSLKRYTCLTHQT